MNMGQQSLLEHTWAAVLILALEGLGELLEGRGVQEPEKAPLSISVEKPLSLGSPGVVPGTTHSLSELLLLCLWQTVKKVCMQTTNLIAK